MAQTKNDKKIENISSYNTFKVFEDIYSKEGNSENCWAMTLPKISKRSSFGVNFLIFVFVLGVLGLGLQPALSYLLKTPYPLMVISENNLAPMVDKNDLVLVRGVINKGEIETNDLIVYADVLADSQNLLVQKVVNVDKDKGILTVRNEGDDSFGSAVEMNQVLGKVVGDDKPFKVPLMGQLIGYLAGRQ